MRPSFIYHQITAVIEIIASIMGFYWIYKNYQDDTYKVIMMLLVMAILVGVHALVHFWEEVHFDFNPMVEGKSKVLDFPIR